MSPRAATRPLSRRIAIRTAAVFRWLHIYASMAGLAATLFFSVTGVTLNHPGWFYANAERSHDSSGKVDPSWVSRRSTEGPDEGSVKRLEVVEQLRKSHAVRGALVEFRVDETECMVTFKGPGYSADAFIDRGNGSYRITETSHGLVAVLNDLHKGRDTGPVWSVVIDVSAVVLTLISVTGLALIFYLKLRRVTGLVAALLGTVLLYALVYFGVP